MYMYSFFSVQSDSKSAPSWMNDIDRRDIDKVDGKSGTAIVRRVIAESFYAN